MKTAGIQLDGDEEWVAPEWVQTHSADSRVRLIECAWDGSAFEKGHLPGACLLAWEADLFSEKEEEYDSLYLDYLCLQRRISRDTICIFYGNSAEEFAGKTRRLFQRFGYRHGRVLRGGREAWIYRGFPLSLQKPNVHRTIGLATASVVSVRCYSHEW